MNVARRPRRTGYGLLLVGVLVLSAAACGGHEGEHDLRFPTGAAAPPEPDAFVAEMVLAEPPPPFVYQYEGESLACTECHEDQDEEEFRRRELKIEHRDLVFRHDEKNRWCLDCHDAVNRDKFRLANGTLVSPEESYRLCGQCHGDKYRDWRAGVHGRRIGYWDGPKKYRLCVHCHNAHAPRFQPIKPRPAPVRPEELR